MVQPTAHEVARDPDWLPHTYDAGGESLIFVRLPRQARHDLMFLSEEHFQSRFPKSTFPKAAVAPEIDPAARAPIHFIFHTSFCGSTLLARALTVPGVAEALKEPDVLINLANRLTRSDDDANRERLELVLKLLERAPAPGETVIVKATNFANRLLEPVLGYDRMRKRYCFIPTSTLSSAPCSNAASSDGGSVGKCTCSSPAGLP